MTDTVDALTALREVAGRLGKGLRLPQRSECEAVFAKLSAVESAVDVPSATEVDAIRREVWTICNTRGVNALDSRVLRDVPLVLWNGERPAAAISGLLEAYLNEARGRALWLIRLIEAWLRDYPAATPAFATAGPAIEQATRRADHPRLAAWRNADETYRIFSPQEGPKRLAAALVLGTRQVAAILHETGMDDPLRAQGNFSRAAFADMLPRLQAALSTAGAAASWARVKPLLSTTQQLRDRYGALMTQHSLRFDDTVPAVAHACLRPWRDNTAHASAPRADILSFLVNTIGDPRLRPQRWAGAEEWATRLVRSWLSAETLEAFLRLIREAGGTNQWEHREAFWRACQRKIPGAEVWVVLGRELARQAKVVNELRGSFGHMNDGHQAVLLVRLGDIVFSEWSNVGSLRAWDVSDKSCPQMNVAEHYMTDTLRAPCLQFPDFGSYALPHRRYGKGLIHHSPERGHWQWRAAALIRIKTGIQLQPHDYMPKQ